MTGLEKIPELPQVGSTGPERVPQTRWVMGITGNEKLPKTTKLDSTRPEQVKEFTHLKTPGIEQIPETIQRETA